MHSRCRTAWRRSGPQIGTARPDIDTPARPPAMLTALGGRPRCRTDAPSLMPPISATVLSSNRGKGEGTPTRTRDQSAAPDAGAPISAESFRFVTIRPPWQVAGDPPSASISLRLGTCPLADSLRKLAAMRAGLRQTLCRTGERLWLLLHALSLLDGPASTAQAIALSEDDYRRLAARQQEIRVRCAQGTEPRDAMNAPLWEAEERRHRHE